MLRVPSAGAEFGECTSKAGIELTIGKPFKKGQSGNPGGRPKVLAVSAVSQNLRWVMV